MNVQDEHESEESVEKYETRLKKANDRRNDALEVQAARVKRDEELRAKAEAKRTAKIEAQVVFDQQKKEGALQKSVDDAKTKVKELEAEGAHPDIIAKADDQVTAALKKQEEANTQLKVDKFNSQKQEMESIKAQ